MKQNQEIKARLDEWKKNLPDGSPLAKELADMERDAPLLTERFGAELSFGTAGLRGKLGPGTNAMNLVTVWRATEGLSNYIEKYFAEISGKTGETGNGAKTAATDAFERAGEADSDTGTVRTVGSVESQFLPEKAVCIAFDPRHMSREFAELAAAVFANHGIRVYTFDGIRPTPELAYLIRAKHTVSGLNLTASHNPKDYNGYKVYWADGCQISGEVSKGIAAEIDALPYFPGTPAPSFEEAKKTGLITMCGEVEDRAYLDTIEALAVHTAPADLDLSIPIVYTPLNGAGSIPFMRVIKERGFTNVHIVEEQKDPDPDFTTVGYPNPEDPKAFALAEKLGLQVNAEVLLATDPDSDRFAIEIRNHAADRALAQGSGPAGGRTRNACTQGGAAAGAATPAVPAYIPLNGNQTGYLLLSYILEGKKETGTQPSGAAAVRSIVTSPLGDRIAEANGVAMFEALTGFKNICGTIPTMEKYGLSYVFGWEESVGYASCPAIRDKDGISAGMLVAEAAAYYSKQGKTLAEALSDIYAKYGFFAEDEPYIIHEGLSGKAKIEGQMADLREHPFTSVAGQDVEEVIDFSNGHTQRVPVPAAGSKTESGTAPEQGGAAEDAGVIENHIPASNVLKYVLTGGTVFFVRPSGTEPKIKFYFYSEGTSLADAKAKNAAVKEAVLKRFV